MAVPTLRADDVCAVCSALAYDGPPAGSQPRPAVTVAAGTAVCAAHVDHALVCALERLARYERWTGSRRVPAPDQLLGREVEVPGCCPQTPPPSALDGVPWRSVALARSGSTWA